MYSNNFLRILSFTGISGMDTFEPAVVVNHEEIIGGFMCLYWLIKKLTGPPHKLPKAFEPG